MMEGYSLSDIRAATEGRDGYNNGEFSWFWIILIFLFFLGFGRNGFGNDNCEGNRISDEFLQRDIFNTNQNVSATSCQTQRDVLENRYNTQLCCCETQKEIMQNRYDNALQTQTLSSQMAQCCCDLRAEGLANTQKILDKLCENEINQLRTDLQSAQLQISQLSQTANITNTLRPFPQPAYITCSPYQTYQGCGYGFGNCGCGCNC